VSAQRRCPACGEPLYGWITVSAGDARDDRTYVVDRCESCGLGVARIEGAASAVDELAPDDEHPLSNRASWQAGIGGDHWAAIDLPAEPLLLTPRAVELLLAKRGLRVARLRHTIFGRNQVRMWQTLLNAFTFHDNFAREVLAGRLTPRMSRGLFAFTIDAGISILAAIPVALVSLPLELAAVVLNRGGEMVVEVEREALPRGPAP
jgi:hypothetical protein